MVQLTFDRREFMAASFAGVLFAPNVVRAQIETTEGPSFLRPFAGNRTISDFASHLIRRNDRMPPGLRRAIEGELDRTDFSRASDEDERRSAEFLAWLTVRRIAPAYLRRAGYDDLALTCEREPDFRAAGLSCAAAQHTIGKEYRDTLYDTPPWASLAYAASAHAATAACLTEAEEIEAIVQTGRHCAWALLQGSTYEEREWTSIWEFSVNTINAATVLESTPIISLRTDSRAAAAKRTERQQMSKDDSSKTAKAGNSEPAQSSPVDEWYEAWMRSSDPRDWPPHLRKQNEKGLRWVREAARKGQLGTIR